MIPAFQQALEERTCEALVAERPSLAPSVERLARAWEHGLSVIEPLLTQGLIDRAQLERATARCAAAHVGWGPYVIERELGRGATGIVFLAHRGGGPCALKVLRAEAAQSSQRRRRFLREAGLLARLDHRGVVRLLDHGERDEFLFLATELVPGGSLDQRPPMGPRAALEFITQLSAALAHAHAAGIVHRDLKPANVLIAEDGSPKLVDFGLAKDTSDAMTSSHTVLGTVRFAAPEQLGWAKAAEPAADVYGLGALLHFLLTGAPPFEPRAVAPLLLAILRGPEPLSGEAARCNALLRRLLDPEPAVRPTLRELERLVGALLNERRGRARRRKPQISQI